MRVYLRIILTLLVAAGMILAKQMGVTDISIEDFFPPEPVERPEESSFSIEFLDVGEGDTALSTGETKDTRSFSNFVKYLEKQGKAITVPDVGDNYELGSAEITVLGPQKGETYSDNKSLVLRILYGNTSFLFTGDSEYYDEQYLLSTGAKLKSTVLKVGHHGSRWSSSEDFIRKVRPDYAVISVGKDNAYGHPKEEVLNRLLDYGAVIYRTDLNGSIRCTSDGNEVTFELEK